MSKYDFSHGGKSAIERIMLVYGFRFKTELGKHFDLTNSTIATWIQRDYFPASLIIECALETGVNLEWLATGIGEMEKKSVIQELIIKRNKIDNGTITSLDSILFDPKLLPQINEPIALLKENTTYVIDQTINELNSGEWLIEMEGKTDIYYLERIPVNKLRITGGDLKAPVECHIEDIKVFGQVIMTCIIN